MSAIEYTTPFRSDGRSFRPGGRIDAEDFPADMEYSGSFGRVTGVRGGAPVRRQSTEPTQRGGSDEYWRGRRKYEARQYALAHPDAGVYGCAIPYEVRLPDHDGTQLWFDADTVWLLDNDTVPLYVEHRTPVGTAALMEHRDGTFIDGTVHNVCLRLVGDRHHLSPGMELDLDALRRRPDGSYYVPAAKLLEVSVVRNAKWAPHTDARWWQRPVA